MEFQFDRIENHLVYGKGLNWANIGINVRERFE